MKKLDLHVHTMVTKSDKYFDFSLESLKQYICNLRINGIAITNHNMFNYQQYSDIRDVLLREYNCEVLPGIEINIGSKGFGHIICITAPEDALDFSVKCDQINSRINAPTDYVSFSDIKSIFVDLGKYLWIPHIEKAPVVKDDILDAFGNEILCGEVGSIKKFIYKINDERSLVPVYFSDIRPDIKNSSFPTRQTFFDINAVTLSEIKKCLLSKRGVALSETEGNSRFEVLQDLPISTGLNVVIGERSSGKTYLMDSINTQYEHVKYIKQFDLIERNPDKAAQQFIQDIAAKRSGFADSYFRDFSDVVNDVKSISYNEDQANLDIYINSLIKFAKETDRADMFSKCTLYNESQFMENSLSTLKSLIESVKNLLEVKEYRDIIDRHIERKDLITLLIELIQIYRNEVKRNLEAKWVNTAVIEIKKSLHIRSAATSVPEIKFYDIQLNRQKIRRFNQLASIIKRQKILQTQKLGRFTVQIEKRAFNGANEFRTLCGKKTAAFAPLVESYKENPFMFLQSLVDLIEVPETDYYKYFALVEYKILNEYGFPVSGGERAEFRLLQEINGAIGNDMLLIDEPESSFDNLFLKNSVNKLIKDLSRIIPIIIVTHNSTVGASIKPDYIIYTHRDIHCDPVVYERYFGLPSDKELVSKTGKKIKNIKALLDCLEAGESAYYERKNNYEVLNH
jgi:hypothetical protein